MFEYTPQPSNTVVPSQAEAKSADGPDGTAVAARSGAVTVHEITQPTSYGLSGVIVVFARFGVQLVTLSCRPLMGVFV
jgi:hypothetical protein